MSDDIGLVVDVDQLVLTRGRDFIWAFQNLDYTTISSQHPDGEPIDYPAGELFFELHTGGQHNALHQVTVKGATSGTYTLNVNGSNTPNIDYNDVSENPQGLAGDLTDAIETALGAGNAVVHPVSLFPAWTLNFNLNVGHALSEQLVNAINKTANDFFDVFDSLLGVDVQMTVTDALNFQLVVTSIRSFDEVGVITFLVDVTSTAVKNFFNAVAGLIGAVNTVNVDFYWNRQYSIEFVGELAEKLIPATTADITNLTGARKAISVEVIDPGKAPLTIWNFTIDGSMASLKVESEEADKIASRIIWQLVFLPEGEASGGDPVGRGRVAIQK